MSLKEKKISEKQKILNYLSITRKGEWVMEGLLRGIQTDWGWVGFRGDRTVRDLIAEGKLEYDKRSKYRIVRAKTLANEIIDRINATPAFKVAPKETKNQTLGI